MGSASAYAPEKLVLGILTSRPAVRADLLDVLRGAWGPVDYEGDFTPFTDSHYYDEEMGTPIQRLFVSFEHLVDPSRLAAIKLQSNALEARWLVEGRRTVNLDPGMLALSRFTLATTKENGHRLPLSNGIYGEITLVYSNGSFRPLDWTYPDYRSEPCIGMLNRLRAVSREQLRRSPTA